MAVKPANSNYHTFTFNGVRAADYGIYVTDVNVFNSAARDVEYIEIPGRDGAFALDRGRFKNISVVYKCAMTQDTDEDFATAISEFRNAIASTKGYKRLEDDIHTDEYRMGVFSKGLEAPTLNTKTATFDVEFNCQPQRFLRSGETAVSVTSGGTINNPTLFEAHPLLQIDGYGSISVNGGKITIERKEYGHVLLANKQSLPNSMTVGLKNTALLNSGDTITVNEGTTITVQLQGKNSNKIVGLNATYDSGLQVGIAQGALIAGTVQLYLTYGDIEFLNKTAGQRLCTINLEVTTENGGETTTTSVPLNIGFRYYFLNRQAIDITESYNASTFGVAVVRDASYIGTASSESTRLVTSGIAIDLDIGETYIVDGDTTLNINNIISLPAKLPALVSGENTITYGNTFNSVKIVPRWWEV